jgi:hypothetical protein
MQNQMHRRTIRRPRTPRTDPSAIFIDLEDEPDCDEASVDDGVGTGTGEEEEASDSEVVVEGGGSDAVVVTSGSIIVYLVAEISR